jgi:membrane protein implicated in regulation of membrane protease activity
VKINYGILARAFWDSIKFPLLILGLLALVATVVIPIFYFLGPNAGFPVVIALLVFSLLVMFTIVRYRELMEEHRKEQKRIINTLMK